MIVCLSVPLAYELPDNKKQVQFIFVPLALNRILAQIGLSGNVVDYYAM